MSQSTQEIDPEEGGTAPFRPEEGLLKAIGIILAAAISVFAFYSAGFGVLSPELVRPAGVAVCAATLILTKYSLVRIHAPSSGGKRALLWLVDAVLLAILSAACLQFGPAMTRIETEFDVATTGETILGFLGIAVVFEIGRRVWGLPLLIVCCTFLAYLIFGHHLPQVVGHFEYTPTDIIQNLWYGYSGVFSTIMGIVISLVFVYILFGVLLESTGAGGALLRIAFALTGRFRGGPAYGAIVASSMFGMMSGSTVANVVGTGTFTIPMMIKRGFKRSFAAGIEATASSGGQIVPPIMGAAAFVMADLTGIPYYQIAIAALVPAALYYYNLFVSVGIEARKQGIEPIPKAERIKLTRSDLVRSLMFVLPVMAVILTLASGRSASMAGFNAIITVLIAGAFNPSLRKDPSQLIKGMVAAGVSSAGILIAVSMIGVIIATMNMTGAGLKFASYINYLGQGQLFLSLVLAMFGAILLGMGMPTLPAYLIIILVMGPAIEMMGLSTLTIHMFVFYFGVASSITPPVALAAYAAAPIANAPPLETGIMAMRLGAAKFLVPFIFAYYPGLLLVQEFEPVTVGWILLRALLAFYLVSTVMAGFHIVRLNKTEAILRIAGAVLLLMTMVWAQIAGAVLIAALITYHYRSNALARTAT